MAEKKVNGKTIETDDGYLPADVLRAFKKRLAEENAKAGNGASKTAKKPAKAPSKKPKKK